MHLYTDHYYDQLAEAYYAGRSGSCEPEEKPINLRKVRKNTMAELKCLAKSAIKRLKTKPNNHD